MDGSEEHFGAMDDGIELDVFVFAMKPTATGTKYDPRDTGRREKRRICPRSHAGQFARGIRTKRIADRAADELDERSARGDFIRRTRPQPAHRDRKSVV
jgi:hypothetical protein